MYSLVHSIALEKDKTLGCSPPMENALNNLDQSKRLSLGGGSTALIQTVVERL